MYCKKCEKELNTEDRFCSFCGTPAEKKKTLDYEMSEFEISEETEFSYKQVNAMQNDRFDEEWEREERREKFTFAIFGVLIVALIVAIAGSAMFLFQKQGENTFMNDFQMSEDLRNELEQSQKRDELLAELEQENAGSVNTNGSASVVLPSPVVTPEGTAPEDSESTNDSKKDKDPTEDKREDLEFVIYDSDVRYLVSADLNHLTAWQIRIARNEIYARHGRMFDALELREYFESKSWYVPSIPAVEFNNSCLSEVELENLNFIIYYEKAHNLN